MFDWKPPPRPDWVQRINEEGSYMNISGVVPLDVNSLLNAAQRATGLSDFGADDWREPFEILIRSLDEEADLNLMGRIQTRSELLMVLEARLRIEDTYKNHPEIEEEEIVQPIFVIGQGRSGTSFLINLLAASPDNGAILQWEGTFPCPPPEKDTYLTDPRIEKCDKLTKQWPRGAPTLLAMHEFGGDLPMEDSQVMALNFMGPSWFGALGQVPSYDAYMTTVNDELAIRYHKRVLKLLQWKNPRQHWVLKDPMHLDRLQSLIKIYPDACFIWPHRDPVRAMASMINLVGTLQWARSDHPFKAGTYEYFLDASYAAQRLNKAIDQIKSTIPVQQFYNILYRDLVRDPMGTVEGIYRHFDILLSEESRNAFKTYIASHPRDARPPHKFSIAPEVAKNAKEAFKFYKEYFAIPDE